MRQRAWRAPSKAGAWDPFLSARCIEVLIAKAEGIRSLPPVMVESAVERIGDAVREAKGTELDLMLRSAAQKSLLQGAYEPRAVLQRFCAELLDRSIISGRGGFLELTDGGPARSGEAMAILAPVAAQAAQCLEARPDATWLGPFDVCERDLLRVMAAILDADRLSPRLVACTSFTDLIAIDPNVRFASTLPLEVPIASCEAEAEVLAMYRRYATEIGTFFERARPTLARRPHPPRKENERDLFAAAG
jgi:hypothetical protein